jgi:tetratricopeptide (TPR) repeat protein
LLRARGQAELAAKQLDAAALSFQRILDVQPDDAAAHYQIARIHAASKAIRPMREHLLSGLRANPKLPLSTRAIDAALGATTETPEHSRLLDEMARVAPEHPHILNVQGKLALAAGNPRKAMEYFATLRRVAPGDPAGVKGLMAAQAADSQPKEAAATAKAWLAEHPDDLEVSVALADVHLRLGQNGAASALYARVLATRPDTWQALNNQAFLTRDSDPLGSLALAERAYALRPGDLNVSDTLAGTLVALAKHEPDQALAHAQRAYANRPDPNVALALTQLLGRQGQAQQAQAILVDAYAVSPDHPVLALRYAEAMVAAGDPTRARAALLRVVDRPFPEQAQAKALLKRLGD